MAETEIVNKVKTDPASVLKAFKKSSEVESLYRFIHENGLRKEALKLMKVVLKKTSTIKKTKSTKKSKVKLQ